jgi:TolB-like protein
VRETPKDSLAAEVAGTAGERLANSIAVLPFANISDDPANEYFCDGISEEILNKLGGIRTLKVIGRTSSFAFKGSDYGIERISALLRVRYVLQGSVRKAGDQLRVSAQLLDAGGVQVWSESFYAQSDDHLYGNRSIGRLIELHAVQVKAALRAPTFSSLYFLLLSCAVLGDWPQADAVNERLLRAPPEGPGRVFRRAVLPSLKGQTDVTVRGVREGLAELGLTLADLTEEEKIIAGVHLARGGDYARAIEVLEPVVDADSPGSTVMPGSFIHGAHALAWPYLKTGADAKANRLLAAEARECSGLRVEGRLRDGFNQHRCAQTELLRGNAEAALGGLEKAVDAGWRDYYLRERDPMWASVASDPRYRALMAKVKADVDRQRAEVRRIDASERFIEKLDVAIAAKAPREE